MQAGTGKTSASGTRVPRYGILALVGSFNLHTGAHAVVTMSIDGMHETKQVPNAIGPVEAIYQAIGECVGPNNFKLKKYDVHASAPGTEANALVEVEVSEQGRTASGKGSHPNTMIASAYAYVEAINALRS